MGKITGYEPFAVDATKKGLPMYYYRKRVK